MPPDLPEPARAPGMNFAENRVEKNAWLAKVAAQSDSWLMSVAFYRGASKLNKEGREQLFQLINELPTCYEVVSSEAKDVQKLKKILLPGSVPPPQASAKRPAATRQRINRRLSKDDEEDADEDDEQDDEADEYADGEEAD
eukprot:jgi/Botrbrau1/6530/Bobra.40_2s0003.1